MMLILSKMGICCILLQQDMGKTVFLTTAVLSLAMQNSVQDLNFYILDFGNSGLTPLNKLSHVADYIVFDDSERFQKLMGILQKEIRERKKKTGR